MFKRTITKDMVQELVNKLNVLLDPERGDTSHISSDNCSKLFFQGIYLNDVIKKYNDSTQTQNDLERLYN